MKIIAIFLRLKWQIKIILGYVTYIAIVYPRIFSPKVVTRVDH